MMMPRERFSNRHDVTTIDIEHSYRGGDDRTFSISYARLPSGKIGEVWANAINGHEKLLNDDMRDSCVALSRGLQYGDSLDRLAKSVLRDNRGKPLGWIGSVIDALKKEPA
jgi:hypothetical protein